MATQKLNLTRDQLATFLKNHDQITQFEKLFALADEVAPASDTQGISIQAGNADAAASEALAQIAGLEQDADINGGVADQKAVQALDALNRIANAMEMIASAPAPQNNGFVRTDYIDFNVGAPHAYVDGRVGWHEIDDALFVHHEDGVHEPVGLATYAIVENHTGVTIPAGSAAAFAGAGTNEHIKITEFIADGTIPQLYIIGIVAADIPDTGTNGRVTVWGHVRNIDTSAWSVGDVLYCSPTVSGGLTNVKPTAPNNCIPIAAVLASHATEGVLFVRPTIEQQKYYGTFTKTTDQSPAAIDTEYLLTFDNTKISNGVTIGTPASRIVVPESGLYRADATIQITSTSASAKTIWVWLKKNGVSIADSSRLVTLDLNNGYIPIATIDPISMAANDYIEIAFAADSTDVTIDSVAATAFAPASPAVILAVTQVQQ